VADDFWREAVALKRYRSHPMMLIGDKPQSYPSYRDIAPSRSLISGTGWIPRASWSARCRAVTCR
jgi:hypothetical protein